MARRFVHTNHGKAGVVPTNSGYANYYEGIFSAGLLVLGRIQDAWSYTLDNGMTIACSGNKHVIISADGASPQDMSFTSRQTNNYVMLYYSSELYPLTCGLVDFPQYSSTTTSSGKRYKYWYGVNGVSTSSATGTVTLEDFRSSLIATDTYVIINLYNDGAGGGYVEWRNKSFENGSNYLTSFVPPAYTTGFSDALKPFFLTQIYEETPPPPPSEDPYAPAGESEPGGGDGTFDFTTDEIPFGITPILGALNSGFVTLYSPTMAEVQNLARYMWAGAFDVSSLKKIVANPMDVILGFSIIPLTENELGLENDYIAIGNHDTQLPAKRVTNQYATIYCDSVDLQGIWGAYLDYTPYTKLQLYLPYIGFVELSADDCMDRTIEIRYSVDIYSGACLAQVYCKTTGDETGHVLYQFSGNCASWYPVTSGQYQNFIISAYNILSGVGMGLAQVGSGVEDLINENGVSNAIGKMISGSVNSLNSIASNVKSSLKPTVQRAGGTGGSAFMMGPQKPYLIITTPKMIIPGDQNKMIGYPSYVNMSLSAISGFTVVDTIHPDGIDCTEEELDEIVSLLKSGVFL